MILRNDEGNFLDGEYNEAEIIDVASIIPNTVAFDYIMPGFLRSTVHAGASQCDR